MTPTRKNIEGTPSAPYSAKSSLVVSGGVRATLSAPNAAFSTDSTFATTAGLLTVAELVSGSEISGSGAPAAAAEASATRRTPSSSCARTAGA